MEPIANRSGLLPQEVAYNGTIPAYLEARARVKSAQERVAAERPKNMVETFELGKSYFLARVELKAAKRDLTSANQTMLAARGIAREARLEHDVNEQQHRHWTLAEGGASFFPGTALHLAYPSG